MVAPSSESTPRAIFLDPDARFVASGALREAYLGYAGTRAPGAPRFVILPEHGLELGIVASEAPVIARAVSSLLSRSLEDAKVERGGHLPAAVVERVQTEIISPWGVGQLWGGFGHRFVLARPLAGERHEIVATILVARRKGTVFFFTGRYNNLRHSTMTEVVDFDQPDADDPSQRWFDRFAFPPVADFKPRAYHHIANFVVSQAHRGEGLARVLLDAIVDHYARDTLERRGRPILHSQFLLCGRGLWQIGDPPWLARMQRLGFSLRWGAESFFLDHDWAPLPPIHRADGRAIGNLEYNRQFGLPNRYLGVTPPAGGEHLRERIAEVVRLADDPRVKLQYFQTLFDFP